MKKKLSKENYFCFKVKVWKVDIIIFKGQKQRFFFSQAIARSSQKFNS